MKDKNKKICVLLPNKNFFGAQIVIIPFFKKLREIFPLAKIIAFSPGPAFKPLRELNLFDDFKKRMKGIRGFLDTVKKIRKENFDIIFTLRRKSERDWLLNLFSAADEKVGFKRKWSSLVFDRVYLYDKNTYRATNFLKLLSFCGVNSINYKNYVKQSYSDIVWLIPCGSKKEKLWPIDNYINLAKRIINELNKKVLFILGPEEEKEIKGYINKSLKREKNNVNFMVSHNLKEILGIVGSCSVAVTNDCGPGHIPQISGIPTLVLFPKGANIKEWVNSNGNLSRAVVSNTEDIGQITVEKVFKELNKMNQVIISKNELI